MSGRLYTAKRIVLLAPLVLALSAAGTRARAEIHVSEARYEAGVLRLVGDSDAPHAKVTLDRIYEERTGSAGEFIFRVRYKPHDCVADVRVGDEIFSAVVSNCLEPGNPGTPAAGPTR
jgi:hypothetical protein